MKRSVDIAIIGQGLAGTTLAWTLLDQGARIAVIDQRLIGAASTVAGGLITPLTGKKIKPEPYFDELWEAAQAHYQRVSHWLDTDVLNTRAALRRLDTTQLKEAWNTADETQKRYAELASAPPEAVSGESSFIAMPTAARLDIERFLSSSRQAFIERDILIEHTVDDACMNADHCGVSIDTPSLNADRVVFCRGWRDSLNPWFNNIQWRPAKGQILTLRIPDFPRGPTVYANGLWLTHLADDAFLCGATYSWSRFDEGPEPEQTATLIDKVNELLTVDYTVAHVSSGTRPIVAGRQPVIGWSHRSERIGIMNGLGSKGSLYAPFIARMMTNSLINSVPVDARFDVQARFPPVCD